MTQCKRYIIDGDFLTKQITGLERSACEIILELDKLLNDDYLNGGIDIELAVPDNFNNEFLPIISSLHVIHPVLIPKVNKFIKKKSIWLKHYASLNDRIIVNIVGPISLKSHSIIKIADVRYREKNGNNKYWDKFMFRFKATLAAYVGVHNAEKIVTVSDFSRSRIIHFFKAPSKKIVVIGEGWQHFERIEEDDHIFNRYPQLKDNDYYFSVGTLAQHKNHKWIIEASDYNPDSLFVICGGIEPALMSERISADKQSNVLFTGRLNDGEMKCLMKHAKAFISPSLYEGFDMPPLEAMSVGTDCIISDIPVHREIYGSSVHYVDPSNPKVNLKDFDNEVLHTSKKEILEKYSWAKSAAMWRELLV